MSRIVLLLAVIAALTAADVQRAFYLGATGSETHGVHRLSDGTWLISGTSPDLTWLPAGVTPTVWSGSAINALPSSASGLQGWVIRVSADLATVMQAQAMPANKVTNIQRIRSTEVPGETTGDIYLSGRLANASSSLDGYWIARLNNNFISGVPTGLTWVKAIGTQEVDGGHETIQPWDVRSDGMVVYVSGQDFGQDWAEMGVLKADGSRGTMEWWPAHWAASVEFHDVAASTVAGITHSAVVFKNARNGQLRSRTTTAYASWGTDANGKPRRGSMPDDIYFSEAEESGVGNGGYTGYRTGAAKTARVGQIDIDRRDNTLAFGYSMASQLPGGQPDFEPAVVVMNASGQILWWDRLYSDFVDANGNGFYDSGESRNSTPDQYVDAVAWDYAHDRLVVLARCHGNNTLNFYAGNELAALTGETGFQNTFTGTEGNIHISWLGAFSKSTGQIYACTYVGDYQGYTAYTQTAIAAGPCVGWASPNAGWPDLNTTRGLTELRVSSNGLIAMAGSSSRPVTSGNGWIPNVATSSTAGGRGAFLRVFENDLSMVRYATLLRESWTTYTGGTSTATGFGLHGTTLIGTGVTAGADLARIEAKPPAWGANTASGDDDGFIVRLDVDAGSDVAPVITSAASAMGTVGTTFFYQIATTGFATWFGATTLPAGLTLNASSGLITGIPTTAGTVAVTLTASSSLGSDTQMLTVVLAAASTGGGTGSVGSGSSGGGGCGAGAIGTLVAVLGLAFRRRRQA